MRSVVRCTRLNPQAWVLSLNCVLPGWSSSPKPPKLCGTCPRPVSGCRKSNYFLNGPTDTEVSFISPPRGCRDLQRTSGPAQKESGSYINNTVPGRPPQGSGEKSPPRDHRHTDTWHGGVPVCGGAGGKAGESLSRASATLSPGPQLSQRKFNDSVSFLSNK